MKKNSFLIIALLLLVLKLSGQEIKDWEMKMKIEDKEFSKDSVYWAKGNVLNLGFDRVGLYNWSGGGQNSMSLQGLMNSFINYKHNNITWNNQLAMSFGIIRTGYGDNIPWLKNDDRIEIISKFGRRTRFKWDYSLLFNFRTQFTKGYNSNEERSEKKYFSRFLAPAFPLLAMGVNYNAKEDFACFISPATIKSTLVLDEKLSNAGEFGVDSGRIIRVEAGGYLNFSYQKQQDFLNLNDLGFKTNLSLFSNYVESPQNIDITWETLTSYKLKKLLSITFSTYLIYDHDIKLARFNKDGTPIYLKDENGSNYLDNENNPIQKKGAIMQFKEAFSLGLMFNF